MTGHSFLVYRRFLYLKLSLVLCGLLLLIYHIDKAFFLTLDEAPNGGTAVGYGLGTLATLLILILLWFGVRKRQYLSRFGTIQGWLSAHVYLGLATLFISTLHTGFQFAWNIHTLAYLFLVSVVISGLYGVWMYVVYPKAISQNLSGLTPDILHYEINSLEKECLTQAEALERPIFRQLQTDFAIDRTQMAKHYGEKQLQNDHDNYDSTLYFITECMSHYDEQPQQQQAMQHLLALLGRRNTLIKRLQRNQWQYNQLYNWQIFHIPLSFALLSSLIVHIIVVFLYR